MNETMKLLYDALAVPVASPDDPPQMHAVEALMKQLMRVAGAASEYPGLWDCGCPQPECLLLREELLKLFRLVGLPVVEAGHT